MESSSTLEYSIPVICVICHDALVDKSASLEVVATQCGHVFHKTCLASWYISQAPKRPNGDAPREDQLKGQCPLCNTPGWFKRALKIYLNSDKEELNELKLNMDVLSGELEKNKKKLADTQEELRSTQKTVCDQHKELIKAKKLIKDQEKVIDTQKKMYRPQSLVAASKEKPSVKKRVDTGLERKSVATATKPATAPSSAVVEPPKRGRPRKYPLVPPPSTVQSNQLDAATRAIGIIGIRGSALKESILKRPGSSVVKEPAKRPALLSKRKEVGKPTTR